MKPRREKDVKVKKSSLGKKASTNKIKHNNKRLLEKQEKAMETKEVTISKDPEDGIKDTIIPKPCPSNNDEEDAPLKPQKADQVEELNENKAGSSNKGGTSTGKLTPSHKESLHASLPHSRDPVLPYTKTKTVDNKQNYLKSNKNSEHFKSWLDVKNHILSASLTDADTHEYTYFFEKQSKAIKNIEELRPSEVPSDSSDVLAFDVNNPYSIVLTSRMALDLEDDEDESEVEPSSVRDPALKQQTTDQLCIELYKNGSLRESKELAVNNLNPRKVQMHFLRNSANPGSQEREKVKQRTPRSSNGNPIPKTPRQKNMKIQNFQNSQSGSKSTDFCIFDRRNFIIGSVTRSVVHPYQIHASCLDPKFMWKYKRLALTTCEHAPFIIPKNRFNNTKFFGFGSEEGVLVLAFYQRTEALEYQKLSVSFGLLGKPISKILADETHPLFYVASNQTITVFRVSKGQANRFELTKIKKWTAHSSKITDMTKFDENHLITGCEGGSVRVWSISYNGVELKKSTRKESQQFLCFAKDELRSLAVNSNYLVALSYRGSVKVYSSSFGGEGYGSYGKVIKFEFFESKFGTPLASNGDVAQGALHLHRMRNLRLDSANFVYVVKDGRLMRWEPSYLMKEHNFDRLLIDREHDRSGETPRPVRQHAQPKTNRSQQK